MKLDSKVYDILKWIAQLLLPAMGTLYFALSQIWGFGYGEEVLGTITAIDTFLGVILGLSQTSYDGDGTLEVDTTDPDRDVYRMNFNGPLDELKKRDIVIFKVNPQASLNFKDNAETQS